VAVAVREAQKACALKNVELKKMTISAKVLGLDGPCKSSYVYVANRWHFEYVKPGASELASTITMEIEFPKPERSDDD
jgi:hypothetical protein